MSDHMHRQHEINRQQPTFEISTGRQAAAQGEEPASAASPRLLHPESLGRPTPSVQQEPASGHRLWQIFVILVVLLVMVNIPFNSFGTGLAHISPETTAMVIYDNMVLQGSGPEVYVLDNYKLRLVSSEEAFQKYFRKRRIRFVSDKILDQFEQGELVRRLITCRGQGYVYALENGQKRRIEKPNVAGGVRPWDDVQVISCSALKRLPLGSPVAAGEGT